MQNASSRSKLYKNMRAPTLGKKGSEKLSNSIPLNFKVSEEFRREFRIYAARNNLKLNQVLVDAFAALKEKESE